MPSLSLDLATAWQGWLAKMWSTFSDAGSPFWWPSLASAFAAGFIILGRRPNGAHGGQLPLAGFLRELRIDGPTYLINAFLGVLFAPWLVAASTAGITVVVLAMGVPAASQSSPTPGWMICAAAAAFVVGDFFLYWTHRIFHWRSLWVLHRFHHEPQFLTPVTAFRFWPPEQLVHMLGFNLGTGMAAGLMYQLHGSGVPAYGYAGANVFLVAWSLAFAHLRHSHIPMGFPRWLSRIFVSPHMHQAHHSVAAMHHHCNFATALSLWDWLFGTLYIPQREERFSFGVEAN